MNFRNASHHFIVATVAISLGALAPSVFGAETFSRYVAACKSELGIESVPQFSCKDTQFRTRTDVEYLGLDFSQSTDFVAHRQINDAVDAVFACRWLGINGASDRAVSGEMIVHNRRTGGTCFFDLQDTFENGAYPQVPINPVSPTAGGAANVWALATGCTSCHAAGPYVASPKIVSSLARYGLINDGHDVWGGFYHAVGSANSDVAEKLNAEIGNITQPPCASACHVMRGEPEVASRIGAGLIFGAVVMPSINHVITDVVNTGAMPPDSSRSDYRWINRDVPSYSGDYETLDAVQWEYPALYCDTPNYMQARVIDDTPVLATNSVPQVLNRFNVRDGLVCLNADQSDGKCLDYQTRYRCAGGWRDWQSHDRPSASGDWEPSSSYSLPEECNDSPPDAIQARWYVGSRAYTAYGPPDRLYQYDQYGLICRNQDQPSGQSGCHNYSVRFICP